MSVDDDDAPPRHREPDRAELGEMVWKGHGGRRPRVLAHGGYGDKRLVLGEGHIYWTDETDGSITRLPKDGGVPLVLAADQRRPTALALHGGFLYWAVIDPGPRSTVVRMPQEGGDIEPLAVGSFLVQSIAVAGEDVYWSDFGDGIAGAVWHGSVRGTPPVRLASKQKQPDSIVADERDVLWTNTGNKRPTYFMDGSVMRSPRDGKKKRWILAKDQSLPTSIAIDGDDVYWATGASYEAPYTYGAIMKRPRVGGKARELASFPMHGALLAVDATHVYCLYQYEGSMFRVLKAGGEPEQILSSVSSVLLPTFVGGFALDDTFLYWTARHSREAGGALWKMPKSATPTTGSSDGQAGATGSSRGVC